MRVSVISQWVTKNIKCMRPDCIHWSRANIAHTHTQTLSLSLISRLFMSPSISCLQPLPFYHAHLFVYNPTLKFAHALTCTTRLRSYFDELPQPHTDTRHTCMHVSASWRCLAPSNVPQPAHSKCDCRSRKTYYSSNRK